MRKSFRMMNQLKEVEIQYGFDDQFGTRLIRTAELGAIQNTFMQRIELVKLVFKNSMNLRSLTVRVEESLAHAPPHLGQKFLADLQNICSCARSPSNAIINILHC